MDKDFVIIVGVLFVVILLSLSMTTSGISGFYASTRGLVEYPYEGFSDYQSAYEVRAEVDEDVVEGYRRARKYAVPAASTTRPTASTSSVASSAKKVEGFEGLQSGPIDEQIIGFMYNNEANTTCKGYGYTMSGGNVCMSASDIKLLTTRGMNASGVSDQIG
jgi:hypothetical protein